MSVMIETSRSSCLSFTDCAFIRDTGYRHVGYTYFVSDPSQILGPGPPQGPNCYNPWMWYKTCIFGANSDNFGWTCGEDIGDYKPETRVYK
ncbi:hypothetical protein CORC01_08659 [Colletotrichum orchidophilum]|uniref:Uncharacterized protein n=1 Tax=Colletotrichum orchidophilum TaxID=1209926 RepID=A0A1G4B3M2_9PEZI|nr:uncharacterized protein CORC01_08659 [Colletotrichum orchidophilum]OHE95966.1 hypothetical protein CORC01_08659 [Colletotrichum orchidophilum]